MSAFLSAAENVRRDLKKDGGRKPSGSAGVGESYFCLVFVCAVPEKYFNYSKTIIFIYLVPLCCF